MANQTHRLLVDGELHRPERSGFGNPNNLELTNVENGQYFQDETTGSIYRYNGDSDIWELLVGYDRDNQRITNIGAQTVDGKIGELTVGAGVAPPAAETEGEFETSGQQNIIVRQLTANLFVPVATGDELKLISVEDESVERYVTVVEGAESGGEVTIDIQDDLFRQYFPIGSHIILDGAQFEAKFSVDPSRIVLKVNEERELSEFGTLVPPNGTATTIGENLDVGFEGPQLEIASTNVSADNPVRIVAGEKIQVYEPFIDGETRVQEFTVSVEGGGSFSSSPFVVPVEETTFTQVFTTKALVREPAFSSSSRISVLSDEIVLKVDSNGNIAAITLSGNADDGSQITIVADDVNINNINFDGQAGTIGSDNYVEDASGWQIEGNGDAEFNSVKIRNGVIVNSIDPDSYTAGNIGIRIVDTLPANGDEGEVVFLSTDNKLYRWTGSAWTKAVETDDLTGQITETQISNDAISTPKLQANAITANEIAANAVTANKILAGAITAAKIDANAVTADKIAANAVTAGKISVNNLQAVNAETGNLSVTGKLSLTSGELEATNGTGNVVTLDADGITGVSNTLGTVFELPSDGSAPTFSSGVINETVYEITNSAVLRTSETALDGGSNSAGVLINNTGIFAGEDNQNTGNANIRIKSDGTAAFRGDIDARGVSTATAFAYNNIEIDSSNLSTYLKQYTHSGNTYHVLDLTTASNKESGQYIKFTVDTRSGGTDRPITHIVPPSNNADDSFEVTIEVSGDGDTNRDEFVSFLDAPVDLPTVTLSDGGSQLISSNFKIEAFRIFQGETQFDHLPMEGTLNGFGGFLQGVTHGQYTFRKDDDSFRLINSSVAQNQRAIQGLYIGKLEGGALLQAEPGSLGQSDGFDFIISPTKRYQNAVDSITESDDYTLSDNFDFSNEFRFSQDEERWEFDGDVYIGGTLTNPSDQRYKENVDELGDVLDKVRGLQTVIYDLKDFLPSDDTKMIGLFAQEVQEVFPEAVVDGFVTDDNQQKREMKSVSYTQLVPVLVKAVQELEQQNKELKTRIEALEQQS